MPELDIRYLDWTGDTCAFFTNGHVDISTFIEEVKPVIEREMGPSLLEEDEPDWKDVQHTWFRMMSPSEAKSHGYDYGFMQVREDPGKRKRGGPWPVTLLVL
jgi:hypothetical protein